MDLYNTLKLTPARSRPSVWISRLAIYEDIRPKKPVAIRDVPLTRGLNIVWAEESDEERPAEISGHSAGKTTFCRFLRYVLGEKTFGKKAVVALIRKSMPEGYVAAEIHVGDKKWAVRRPFGSGRMSYILESATIEEMFEQNGQSVSQDDYCEKLGLVDLLHGMATAQIVQTEETIEWGHVLAWCARDQEARFQNIHDWRSPRSESETPGFRFEKAGPLFVMRAVLGLFAKDELKGEERLSKLYGEKERLEKLIEEQKREPQFRVNLYKLQLRAQLKALFPDVPDIDARAFRSDDLFTDDLNRLAEKGKAKIQASAGEIEAEFSKWQNEIDRLGGEIRALEKSIEDMDSLFKFESAGGRELDDALLSRQADRRKLREYLDNRCPLGGLPVHKCSYVIDRQDALKSVALQDAHAIEQAEAKRTEKQKEIDAEKEKLKAEIMVLES